MNEAEMIALIEKKAHEHAIACMSKSHDGDVVYQSGIRQGIWRGLHTAIEVIQQKLKEKQDKEKEL